MPALRRRHHETRLKTDTEHQSGNHPERRKHLKSLVLGAEPADDGTQSAISGAEEQED